MCAFLHVKSMVCLPSLEANPSASTKEVFKYRVVNGGGDCVTLGTVRLTLQPERG